MPTAPLPACYRCRRGRAVKGGLCQPCRNDLYGPRWKRLRAYLLMEHVRQYGWVCPGWGVPKHPSTNLQVDHIQPVSRGGQSLAANTQVLCAECNNRKGARGGRPLETPRRAS